MTINTKKKSNYKEEIAIAALLSTSTIGEAADAIGVSEQTVWRWLQKKDFKDKYQKSKKQVLQQAIARLQTASGNAVETLLEVMGDSFSPASTRVAAAKITLDLSLKVLEYEEIESRIQSLEKKLNE